ncbi:hypothetical protein C4K03_4710 [Pseudomonas synxantha]|uniref:Uncharacterized protein n=1 Tax=Pseudomonas synxantha TaxID=47883 RepID=A0A3G7UE53_9PSED|nr:hypothetical protein [Pseudomonas synxantha]AZE56848.1 hypothetical protein C4K03_4710 [Pseudomonas synxantha]
MKPILRLFSGAMMHITPDIRLQGLEVVAISLSHLRGQSGWSSSASAMLRSVAAELDSRGERFSDSMSNERFLELLQDFCRAPASSLPAILQPFAVRVADIIESDPARWSALSGLQRPLAGLPSGIMVKPLDGKAYEQTAANLCRAVLTHLIIDLTDRCLSGVKPLRQFYTQLSAIQNSNLCARGMLQSSTHVLDSALAELADTLGGHALQSGLSQDLQVLHEHLVGIRDWLRAVDTAWDTLEDGRRVLQSNDNSLTKTTELLALLENRLPSADANNRHPFGHVVAMTATVRRGLEQVNLLQTLSANSGPVECLRVIAGSDDFVSLAGDTVADLCRTLAQGAHQVPYPDNGSFSQNLGWLTRVLTDPALAELLQPQLETLLGSPERARGCVVLCHVARMITRFPGGMTLAGQLHYLLTSLNGDGVRPWLVSLPALSSLSHALETGDETRMLLKALMGERVSGRELWPLAKRAGAEMLCRAVQSALPAVAGHYLPAPLARELSEVGQSTRKEETWGEMLARAVPGTLRAVAGLMADWMGANPVLVMNTLQAAGYLGQERSMDELFDWFIRQDTSADGEARSLHKVYLTAALCLNLWDLQDGSVQEQEHKLVRLSESLQMTGVVKAWPALGKVADLMPLIPSLLEAQKEMRCQPVSSSMAGWLEQWTSALEQSTNPRLQAAREKLIELAGKWVSDALMPVVDWMVSQPTGFLPGAEAAALPSDEREKGGDVRLLLGGGLGAVGMAMAAYGVSEWLRSKGQGPNALQAISTEEETPVEVADNEHHALRARGRREALAMQRSFKTDNTLPLLGGVVTMAVGGWLLNGYYTGRGNTEPVAPDAQRTNRLIDGLRLPDLSFIFDSVPSDAGRVRRGLSSRKIAVLRREPDGTKVWQKGDAPSSALLPHVPLGRVTRRIQEVLANAGLSHIYERAAFSSDVLRGPDDERTVRVLIKSTQLLSALIEELEDEAPPQSYFQVLKSLKDISGELTGEEERRIVNEYQHVYELVTPLVAGPGELDTESHSVELTTAHIHDALNQIAKLFDPILDPAIFLDNYLTEKIGIYAKGSGLEPDSCIKGVILERSNRIMKKGGGGTDRHISVQSYTLRELATRHYIYDIQDKSKARSGKELAYFSTEHRALVDQLLSEDLQDVMTVALKAFSSDPYKHGELKKHYKGMILLRCLEYLSTPHNPPLYVQAVEKFMTGALEAKEVYFHGLRLNGVFIIPTDSCGGLLCSVDEPTVFHLFGHAVTDRRFSGQFRHHITACPDTAAFRAWVLHKIPLKGRLKYETEQSAFLPERNGVREWVRAGSVPLVVRRQTSPLQFKNATTNHNLPDMLFAGLMERLESDVDSLVLTKAEIMEKNLLNCLKYMLEFLSIAAGFAMPGTGSVLGRVLALAVGIGLDVAAVGIGLYQSVQSDRLQDAEALRDDAIMAGVCIGLGFVPEVGEGLVKSLPAVLSRYKKLKPKVREQFSQLKNKTVSKKGVLESSLSQEYYKKMETFSSAFGSTNPVRKAARDNIMNSHSSSGVCWDYAIDVLREGKLINSAQADIVSGGFVKAASYKSPDGTGGIDHLFKEIRTVESDEDLLKVKCGELVTFLGIDPNLTSRGYRPIHVMTSIGNGRFTGMKNEVLDDTLGAGKGIFTAEELGSFTSQGFSPVKATPGNQRLQVKVGYLNGTQLPYPPSIVDAANAIARESDITKSHWKYIADILERSGELAPEQADAFRELIEIFCVPQKGGVRVSLQHVLKNPQLISTKGALDQIPKGHIVVVTNSEFFAQHTMISLGDGKFATTQLDALDDIFSKSKRVVTAKELQSMLVDGKLNGLSLRAGAVNVKEMRVRSLLGKDSSFIIDAAGVLTITVHSAPMIINFMDVPEFSHIIRGLVKVEGNGMTLQKLKRIKLASCYGALGTLPTGKVLANLLDKEVLAYPFAYSKKIDIAPEWWRPRPIKYLPDANQKFPDRLYEMSIQSSKNHELWSKLIGIYARVNSTQFSRINKRSVEPEQLFYRLFDEASRLVMKKIDINDFLNKNPEYLKGIHSANESVREALASITTQKEPMSVEEFAERVIRVVSLTTNAFEIFKNFMSKESSVLI